MNRSITLDPLATVVVLLLVAVCSGCAPISLKQIASVNDSGRADYIQRSTGEGYLTVYRGGKIVDVRRGMTLNPGDEIETSADGSAIIRFADFGSVTIFPNTRVRIGSLEVFFGRIFADVRGLFSTSGGGVVAGVAGTQYLFEVGARREVRTVVMEGSVNCSSSSGSWAPIRLESGRELWASEAHSAAPRVGRADPREMREILHQVEQIKQAPEEGYCCQKGQVTRALSNSCQGKFYNNRRQADSGCSQGWCCRNEKVYSTLRYECTGKFYSSQSSAVKACTPPPDPVGWCCINYRLSKTTSKQCRGTFYLDAAQAKQSCVRPPQIIQ